MFLEPASSAPPGRVMLRGVQNSFEIGRLKAVGRESLLRIIEIDLFRVARRSDRRERLRRAPSRVREGGRCIGRAGDRCICCRARLRELADLGGIVSDHGRPSVGMEFGFVQPGFDEGSAIGEDVGVGFAGERRRRRRNPGHEEAPVCCGRMSCLRVICTNSEIARLDRVTAARNRGKQ